MLNFKKVKILLITACLSFVFVVPVQAATYKVTSGDSLYKIGTLFNTSSTTIMINNNLSSSIIYPGQALNVTAAGYTVKAGDSLFLIAYRYGIPLNNLRKANNKWDNFIYPGQTLILPGINSSSTPAVSKPVVSTPIVSYTASDLDLLSRLITSEAQGQPYNAQVSVGAVVLNRVKDSRFPNTIHDVIYEVSGGYYQFTPVLNGFITKPATAESIKAAKDALSGVDPTHGAVYYFDDSTTNAWLWSKPIAARIDRMVFTY
jgi:N-acetylmuramoyl-L-alanine amidase